jgi:hypothetical protein
MRRSRTAVLLAATVATVLSLVGAALVVAPASYAGTVPTAPYDLMTIQGPTDNALQSGIRVYGGTGTTVSGHVYDPNGVFMTGLDQGSGSWLNVWVVPPTGSSLAVGHYDTLTSPDASHAELQLSYNSGSCTTYGAGSLDIGEVTFGASSLTAFAATYAIDCDGTTIKGDLRYHSSVPYALGGSTPPYPTFGTVDEGTTSATQTLTIGSAGPTPTVISGPATITGGSASSFTLVSDTCNGLTLSGGQTCTVGVAANPQQLGDVRAAVELPDNSAGGSLSIPLYVSSVLGAKGMFYAEPTRRVLDTRRGIGAPKQSVAGGSTIHVKVTGIGTIPATGVSAVVLNLTETGSTTSGYATAFPTGKPRPLASSINYVPNVTRANLVTVQVGSGGRVDLYNCCGHVQLIADVSGWFAADDSVQASHSLGQTLQTVQPERVLDTRTWSPAGLKSGWEDQIAFDYGSDYNNSMSAVLVTVTAVRPGSTGYLSAYNGQTDPRASSTLNMQPHVTSPNLAVVPVTTCVEAWCNGYPSIRVYNGSGRTTNVLVDILGVFTGGNLTYGQRYRAMSPTRIVDTRSHLGALPLGPASTTIVDTPAPVADYYTGSLMANVTAIKPSLSTFLTLWLNYSGASQPRISSSNPAAGATVANTTVTEVGANNDFKIYNASGTTNVAIDVSGTFEFFPPDFPAPPGLRAGSAVRRQPVVRRQVQHLAPGAPTPLGSATGG